MTITLSQLKDKINQSLAESGTTDPSVLQSKLWEFMSYGIENYELLDEGAKSYVDQAFDGLQKAAQTVASVLPDGLEKRRLLRQLSLARGGHFQAENLLLILESSSQLKYPIVAAAREAFLKLLQSSLDVLFDVTRSTHEGAATFAKIGLCYWAIDELLAAVRLAQCAFSNQSYAHIRTDHEILDLIDLFDKEPEWAQLWMSGDEKKVWSSLKPAAVRKKLGIPKFDPMYSFLSEHGSHGTYRGLQARSLQVKRQGDAERKNIKLWVGGSPIVHHIVWTNSLCVYTSLQLLVKSVRIFADYLNADEIRGVLEASGEITGHFFREHYVGWAKDEGLNYQPVSDFLNKAPWKKPE